MFAKLLNTKLGVAVRLCRRQFQNGTFNSFRVLPTLPAPCNSVTQQQKPKKKSKIELLRAKPSVPITIPSSDFPPDTVVSTTLSEDLPASTPTQVEGDMIVTPFTTQAGLLDPHYLTCDSELYDDLAFGTISAYVIALVSTFWFYAYCKCQLTKLIDTLLHLLTKCDELQSDLNTAQRRWYRVEHKLDRLQGQLVMWKYTQSNSSIPTTFVAIPSAVTVTEDETCDTSIASSTLVSRTHEYYGAPTLPPPFSCVSCLSVVDRVPYGTFGVEYHMQEVVHAELTQRDFKIVAREFTTGKRSCDLLYESSGCYLAVEAGNKSRKQCMHQVNSSIQSLSTKLDKPVLGLAFYKNGFTFTLSEGKFPLADNCFHDAISIDRALQEFKPQSGELEYSSSSSSELDLFTIVKSNKPERTPRHKRVAVHVYSGDYDIYPERITRSQFESLRPLLQRFAGICNWEQWLLEVYPNQLYALEQVFMDLRDNSTTSGKRTLLHLLTGLYVVPFVGATSHGIDFKTAEYNAELSDLIKGTKHSGHSYTKASSKKWPNK